MKKPTKVFKYCINGDAKSLKELFSTMTKEKIDKILNDAHYFRIACRYGDYDIVKLFIKYGVDVDIGANPIINRMWMSFNHFENMNNIHLYILALLTKYTTCNVPAIRKQYNWSMYHIIRFLIDTTNISIKMQSYILNVLSVQYYDTFNKYKFDNKLICKIYNNARLCDKFIIQICKYNDITKNIEILLTNYIKLLRNIHFPLELVLDLLETFSTFNNIADLWESLPNDKSCIK